MRQMDAYKCNSAGGKKGQASIYNMFHWRKTCGTCIYTPAFKRLYVLHFACFIWRETLKKESSLGDGVSALRKSLLLVENHVAIPGTSL